MLLLKNTSRGNRGTRSSGHSQVGVTIGACRDTRASQSGAECLEGAFKELLERLAPSPRLFKLARAMFRDAWNQRDQEARAIAQTQEREAARIEKQISTLLDRIVDATSSSVVAAYEKRIAELERAASPAVRTAPAGHAARAPSTICSNSPWASSQAVQKSGNGQAGIPQTGSPTHFCQQAGMVAGNRVSNPANDYAFQDVRGFEQPQWWQWRAATDSDEHYVFAIAL